jgi:hypothetical protein
MGAQVGAQNTTVRQRLGRIIKKKEVVTRERLFQFLLLRGDGIGVLDLFRNAHGLYLRAIGGDSIHAGAGLPGPSMIV